ncbi:hypothetical protein GWI33_015119 [Rhynchophorus ferrugineus]|uniref:Uncharacterized protein n=1 Tax=Rhynchophorus ferrugineus TaxID=354439 RepID=A0A834I614_RHYFE|nr:hypothetical protein GWI33_015119 [Rhynchophorus ferrugineus]
MSRSRRAIDVRGGHSNILHVKPQCFIYFCSNAVLFSTTLPKCVNAVRAEPALGKKNKKRNWQRTGGEEKTGPKVPKLDFNSLEISTKYGDLN